MLMITSSSGQDENTSSQQIFTNKEELDCKLQISLVKDRHSQPLLLCGHSASEEHNVPMSTHMVVFYEIRTLPVSRI